MSQSTKKANRSDDIDRISNLPGNVIDGILKHLNISELVSTSILSKKWRFMWMSVPELEFCYNFFNRFEGLDDPGLEISRIITFFSFTMGRYIGFVLKPLVHSISQSQLNTSICGFCFCQERALNISSFRTVHHFTLKCHLTSSLVKK
jgi:hypothetical protein